MYNKNKNLRKRCFTYKILIDVALLLVALPVRAGLHFEMLENVDVGMLPNIRIFLFRFFLQLLPVLFHYLSAVLLIGARNSARIVQLSLTH